MTDERTAELLAGYPVVVEIPVAWGDMDYFRHVNNIVFFRYFESARIEYLERIGFRELADDDPVGPIWPRPAAASAVPSPGRTRWRSARESSR
jgi:acyl-CoA thioester hydrolase